MKTNKKRLIPLMIAAVSFFTFLGGNILYDLMATQIKEEESKLLAYEEKLSKIPEAFDYAAKSILEQKISPRSLIKDQILIVNFWATWCLPCLEEIPSLIELKENLKSEGKTVSIIGINTDEEDQQKLIGKVFSKMNEKLKKKGLISRMIDSFPQIYDPSSKLTGSFNIEAIPSTLVFKNGKFQKIYLGKLDFTGDAFKKSLLK